MRIGFRWARLAVTLAGVIAWFPRLGLSPLAGHVSVVVHREGAADA